MHDFSMIGLYVIVIGGILSLWAQLHAIHGRLDRIQSDLSQFNHELGRHDKSIELLERK
jgi:hypothetical protein